MAIQIWLMGHSVPTPNLTGFINLSVRKLMPEEMSDWSSSPAKKWWSSLIRRSPSLSCTCITKSPTTAGLPYILCLHQVSSFIKVFIPPDAPAADRGRGSLAVL